MTGYVFVTSSGTSQSTYIHIFHLLLWCAASSELAPQSSSSSNQYHLNSYHPRITVEKNTQKAELKMTHRKSYFTWTRKEGQPLHISRSKATLLQIWTKVTTQRASTTHMKQSMVAHEKVTASNGLFLPRSSQSNTPCSPSTGACSCLWCVQKISGTNMPRFRYHQMNQWRNQDWVEPRAEF